MYAFPRSFDRGPIEAMRIERTRDTRTDYFRDHLIAAPLMLGVVCGRAVCKDLFPRSFDRGPIEAWRPAGDQIGKTLFPRSFDRGPIEALSSISYRLRALIISAII